MPVTILAKLTVFKCDIRAYVRPTPFLYYEVTRERPCCHVKSRKFSCVANIRVWYSFSQHARSGLLTTILRLTFINHKIPSVKFFNWQDETSLSRPNFKLGPNYIYIFRKINFKNVYYIQVPPTTHLSDVQQVRQNCDKVQIIIYNYYTWSYSSSACIQYTP